MLRNNGTSAMSLSGWKVRVGSSTATLPSSAQINPGDAATLHFGPGTSAGKDWYLGRTRRA